jgi:hypothetical protein
VRWSVNIPGQPWSGNHANERNAGNRQMHKKPEVAAYQALVTMLTREARPTFWRPQGQVIVEYEFYLFRDIDCTNAIKVIEDAVALALRPEDRLYDRRFLPRAMSKVTGIRNARVIVTLEDL